MRDAELHDYQVDHQQSVYLGLTLESRFSRCRSWMHRCFLAMVSWVTFAGFVMRFGSVCVYPQSTTRIDKNKSTDFLCILSQD